MDRGCDRRSVSQIDGKSLEEHKAIQTVAATLGVEDKIEPLIELIAEEYAFHKTFAGKQAVAGGSDVTSLMAGLESNSA
ncbi:hypothetical protein OAO87_04155 [bacterium]|nr:hypothetical protein [bacterium]